MSRLILASLIVMIGASFAQAQAPEPSVIDDSWKLDFTYDQPRVVRVPNGQGGFDWYWYITYEVVNNGDQDLFFLPDVTIATDQGDIVAANENISPLAFSTIKRMLKDPLLESPAEIVGDIRQGEDYAKRGVIIWKDPMKDIDRFSVFISGLSGETAVVEHPITGEDIYLRRTLELEYQTPGNPPSPKDQADVTTLVSETEVMR